MIWNEGEAALHAFTTYFVHCKNQLSNYQETKLAPHSKTVLYQLFKTDNNNQYPHLQFLLPTRYLNAVSERILYRRLFQVKLAVVTIDFILDCWKHNLKLKKNVSSKKPSNLRSKLKEDAVNVSQNIVNTHANERPSSASKQSRFGENQSFVPQARGKSGTKFELKARNRPRKTGYSPVK